MATTVSSTSELRRAVENAGAGDEIVARGGTYGMSSQWTIRSGGDAGNPLVIRAADGETPSIEFAAGGSADSNSGIQLRGPYVHFRGFEVVGSGWKGVNTDGNAHDVVLENLDVHHGNLWGIMNNGCDNVVFRNCDSHDNFDDQNGGEHSDGFNMTGPASNGLIEGCRSWNNGDDGYDFWVSEGHTIRYCWAWNNGRGANGDGNGFKLGGGPNEGGYHLVHHCISYDNGNRGFDWNTTDNPLEVYNCTSVGNAINYRFNESGDYTLRNNVSKDGDLQVASGVDDQNNSWNLGVTPAFASTDPSSSDFMALADGDEAIDAGVDVGLDYSGDAPDLGAVEYASDSDSGSGGDGGGTNRITVDGSTKLAASQGSIDPDSKLQTSHTGFTDAGYVNFVPDSGGYLYWPLEVAAADTYAYELRYAHGKDADRTVELNVAGTTRELTFPSTGGWDQWETVTGTFELPSGSVDLLIETIGEDGGNVDKLTLWPAETREDTGGDTPNHGYRTPEQGAADWHEPLNSNFEALDADVPVADAVGVRDEYTPAEGALYFATDTGDVYVGTGSEWTLIGSLS